VPLSKLEPIFKRWIKEAQSEIEQPKFANTEQPEQFLTIQQAAAFLNLSVATMYSKVSRSEIPVMKRGKRLYFSLKELTEYLRNGKKKPLQK
jgi:DNA binding domain, excisionase family